MTEHILKMVKTANAEAIQKYVKHHLPKDSVSLERIYKELLTYQFKPQPDKTIKEAKRSISVKSFKSNQSKSNPKGHVDRDQVRKTETLIKMLRQKGLKVEGDCQQAGLTLFSTHRQKLVKPLLTNAKLLKSQTAQIDRVIKRFQINNEFYGSIQSREGSIKENDLDPQMEDFFKRRKSALQSINNQHNKAGLNRRFSEVEPRLYQTPSQRQSFQKLPTTQIPQKVQTHLSSTKALMSSCENELSLQKFKTIKPKMNLFRELEFEQIGDRQDQQQLQLQDASVLRKRIQKEQYERYTNSYMQMMNKKTKMGSKCRLSKYDKDLLRDAKKMRRIIDFDNK